MTDRPSGPSRRSLLLGLGAGAGTLGVGVAGGAALSQAIRDGGEGPSGTGVAASAHGFVPFRGEHQTAITTPAPAAGLMAALDVVAPSRDGLAECLSELSAEIEHLMSGRPYPVRDPSLPPPDTGTMGDKPVPVDLSVAVSVGASLFDDRFGLAHARPRQLVQMPFMANDRLDPERSHGDLLLTISAEHADATLFALRQLMRRTRAQLVLRWLVEGYNRRISSEPSQAPSRNLLGFKDGTANLDVDNRDQMQRYVWVGPGDEEPAWAAGGSYHVVRVIRMLVESWDRASLAEQEAIFGRHKSTGAPLGQARETDTPDYSDDPDGRRVPLDAHIRLANPRTPESADNLILRRGFNYSRGFDKAGLLDQGLAFVCFQRSLEKGFLAVQGRLNGEPLEEYIRTEGGGFFFALPGVTGDGDYLGRSLVEA